MNRNIVLSLATAAAIALTTPALAGAPDDPHERRDLVQAIRCAGRGAPAGACQTFKPN